MVIVILGPAGSGKDTQAQLLAKDLSIPSISTGLLAREEIEKGGVLGRFIDLNISKGKLIPTELLYELLVEKLAKLDTTNGFIINGAPRTFEQIALIDKAARYINSKITFAFSLEVPIMETIVRLQRRSGVEKRIDDSDLRFVIERLHSHYQDSEDIKNEYKDRKILYEIDGSGEIDIIHESIMEVIRNIPSQC